MSEYVNPETIARYEAGFKQFAKNGALPVLQIVPALEAAKEDYTQDDVFEAAILSHIISTLYLNGIIGAFVGAARSSQYSE